MCDRGVQDLALCRVTSPTLCPPLRSKVRFMLARVRSAAVLGIDAYLVDVETDIANGLPTFATVGLPQGAVKEGQIGRASCREREEKRVVVGGGITKRSR